MGHHIAHKEYAEASHRMIRIAEGVWPNEVSESSFFSRGEYKVDDSATPTMKNSLMYKMSYYRCVQSAVSVSG